MKSPPRYKCKCDTEESRERKPADLDLNEGCDASHLCSEHVLLIIYPWARYSVTSVTL